MKLHKYLLASLMAAAATVGFSSCDNDLDYPPVISPDLGGGGKWDAPLTVEGTRAYYTTYYSEVPDANKYYWTTGYIVGCVVTTETVFVANDNTVSFSAPFGSANNLLLASTPDETDYTKCIALQLPSGNVRSSLNLQDNPANLSRMVTVRGYIDKYLGIAGMRAIDAFNWGDTGIDTGEVETKSSVFTLASAITSGRSYALVANGTVAKTVEGSNSFLKTEKVTVSGGKFTESEKYGFLFTETAAGSGLYYICDYRGKFLWQDVYGSGWSNRPSVADAILKDNKGFIWQPVKDGNGHWTIINTASSRILAFDTNYNSYGLYQSLTEQYLAPDLYEMENDPVAVPDFTPVDGGGNTPDVPDTPVDGNALYTALGEKDAELTAGWEYVNVTLGEGSSYVWSWKEYNNAHYLNASSYVNGAALASEAYAVSPEIDLAGATGCEVSFDHAAKFQTTLRDGCTICVREAGATGWTNLTIPTWPEAGSWAFANSGAISLGAYDGKKIQLAFKYVSTTAGADTWEIKNLKVTGKK